MVVWSWLIKLYWRVRREYLLLRYKNLTLGYGVVVNGRFELNGNGKVSIGMGSRLNQVSLHVKGFLEIGDGVFLNGTSIACFEYVKIGSDCLISDAYIVDNDFHNLEPNLRHSAPTEKTRRRVIIEDNVWIGDNGVVLKGSYIGRDAVIGSNSVVRGVVPPRVVCIGNPAMVVKRFADEN